MSAVAGGEGVAGIEDAAEDCMVTTAEVPVLVRLV